MYLPPLQPVTQSEIYVSGDVTIHPDAAIAPGVILQAAPNCRIFVSEGVCLGMGTIINACSGAIEIESNVILGAGVLIVGEGKIGRQACIGPATTIFNASIESMEVVTAGSLIGDTSRQIDTISEFEPINNKTKIPLSEETDTAAPVNGKSINNDRLNVEKESHLKEEEVINKEASVNDVEIPVEEPESTEEEEVEVEISARDTTAPEPGENAPVFGKLYVNQLLVTLFPQNPNPNNSPQDNRES